MSEAKFSSGPWDPGHLGRTDMKCQCRSICNGGYAGGIASVVVGNGLPIGEGGNDGPPLEEAIANMHLISAAPDMYEALVDARRAIVNAIEIIGSQPQDPEFETLRKVDAALAKARGEKQ
jgi:hypothetical protein